MEPAPGESQRLQLGGLVSNPPVLLLKLNQGPALEQLRRFAATPNGSPTVTFQKDSVTISIPTSDGTTQENHFRLAPETAPNFLVQHDQSGWTAIGHVTNKLHPKDWGKAASAASVVMQETRILSMSQEQQEMKKPAVRTSKKIVEPPSRPSEPVSRPISQKGPPKASASVSGGTKKVGVSQRPAPRVFDSDSSESDDSDEEDEESSSQQLAARRTGGKRPSPSSTSSASQATPIPNKKPRTTVTPIPRRDLEEGYDDDDDDDDDDDEDDEENNGKGGDRGRGGKTHATSVHRSSPPNGMVPQAGKRPRSNANTPPPSSSSSSLVAPHLHMIEAVSIPPEMIPDTSREIQSFDDFERSYRHFKDVWPQYIRLHAELQKNRADFETLRNTMDDMIKKGEPTKEIETELQRLYDERFPVVNPMRHSYSTLHTAMSTLRHQLESYASQHSSGNTGPARYR